MADPIIVSNRSMFWEFLASIATIQGDLSNITAPPFVLAEHSTVELPQYWADHPSLFVAPALAQTPARRALLVLKWFLGSLKNQQYAGRKEQEGVKKPLNAFLGELFLGGWTDGEIGDTRLVAEQVSHHPPITACYLWNEQCGIRAEGFTQQEITFSGTVNIKQKGYAILHIDRHDEDYLIPVPNVKVKGILSGTPYPELTGKYEIVSSTGFVSEVIFEGRGLIMGGTKNGFRARVFNTQNPAEDVYTAKGSWNGGFTIEDATTGETVERCDVEREPSIPITVEDIAEQDPWESRKAWRGVSEALRQGNMRATSNAKSLVEQGQRQMRRDEKQRGAEWKTLFFRRQEEDAPFERLSKVAPDGFSVHRAGGIWKVDREAIEKTNKPYHGDLVPTGAAEPRSAHAQASIGEMNGIPTAKEDAQSLSIGREDAQSSSIGRGDLEKPENIQVEEFLRHKYNSNPR
ncbi:Oxysterol-binding protein [Pleomassaria siparia CBS 279.74]|uniref:Oxysterol-binding protein n=1 Tax=Pleomassaria siparia CBS 279.74 TaxID=1314801 RepID=A0A6G1K7L5_9PLEO|nr:Oxysterol-binding protein [Pleomassaria siparia CBS 279.74]